MIATCRNLNSSDDLSNFAKINSSVKLLQLDVSNTNNIQELSNQLKNTPIDILINNAGIYRSGSFRSVNKDSWIESFITNTIGSYIYRSSKTALNSMMRSLTHDLKSHNIATMTLHPGWVRTDMGGPGGWIDVIESVSGMIQQIENLSIQNTGQYIDYAGKLIKW